MPSRVVITGIGPVTSIGIGKEAFLEGLLRGEIPCKTIPESFARRHRFRSRYHVPFPEFDHKDFEIPTKFNPVLQKEDRLAILGTKLALEDAGISITPEEGALPAQNCTNGSVIIGIGMSSLENTFSSYLAHLGVEHPDRPGKKERYQRMIIPMTMSNSPAAWVSIFYKLEGGSHTVNASCASGTMAIGEAFRRIADGRSQLVVSGGVECMVDRDGATMRGFDMLGTLTTAEDGAPRPYSNNRTGFLFAEGGGAILVLEELDRAVKRDAPIYAEVVDYAQNCDAYNIVQQDKSGVQIARIFEQLSCKGKIDYLNGHGTATALNDETEASAIRRVFGGMDSQPLINSTKGIIGHTIGASGAIETAVTALAISRSRIHGNGDGETIADLNITRESIETDVVQAITCSFGFGGHNAGLLLKRLSR